MPDMAGRNPKHDNIQSEYCFPPAILLFEVRDATKFTDFDTSFELFLLGEGEKKIAETPFPRKSGPYLMRWQRCRPVVEGDQQNTDSLGSKACPTAQTSP